MKLNSVKKTQKRDTDKQKQTTKTQQTNDTIQTIDGFLTFYFSFVNKSSSYRPLQKRERTGKEYGCFPFV